MTERLGFIRARESQPLRAAQGICDIIAQRSDAQGDMGVYICLECRGQMSLMESFRPISALDGNFSVLFCRDCAARLSNRGLQLAPIRLGKIDQLNLGQPVQNLGGPDEAEVVEAEPVQGPKSKWKDILG